MLIFYLEHEVMQMLKTLSEQERKAVEEYDEKMRRGDTDELPAGADQFMQMTFAEFRPDEELVDVGCGTGRAIETLGQIGVQRYFGIDPSEKQVQYCRGKYPSLHYPDYSFAVDEIRTLGEHYTRRFSGFWLSAVLMHLPRTDLVVALKSLRASLKVDAIGYFSTPLGVPGNLEVVHPDGVKVTLYTINEIAYAFAANNFKIGSIFESGVMIVGNAVTF